MKKIYTIFVCICLLAGFVACEKDKDFVLTTLMVQNETITPSYGSATIDCSFKADATISEAFVQYSLSSSFAKYDVAKMTEEKGKYVALLLDLQDNATYYIRYAVSNKYSSVVTEEVIEFQTLQCTVPTVVLDSIVDVWDNRAKAYLHLTLDGGASVTDMGICWGTQTNPTTKDIHVSTEDTLAVLDITSLQSNTRYYVRAYAMNKVGVAYSEEKVFTTLALPEVRTEDVSDIQVNSALLSATLVFDGNDTATIKGFCWSEKSEPTIEGDHIAIDTASAGYTYLLTALLPETQYFVRAYAQNKIGIVYGEEVSFTTKEQSSTEPVVTETITVNGVSFKMVAVGGGTFTMGATSEQGSDAYSNESPTHSVTLSDFAIGETEVTQELWQAVMGSNPSYFSGTNLPVEDVSWNDCQTFISKLNNLTGKNFRLPTEAEWEYAARGGNKSKGYKYAGSNTLGDVAWYDANSSSMTHPVKQKQANELGLYDMSGNVWEWCQDWYGSYSSSAQTNPTGPTSGSDRVDRGGNFAGIARHCRVSHRDGYAPGDDNYNLGLRLALGAAVELEVALPTLTTNAVTQITETTAVAGGNVTADGNASVTERGIVYGKLPNPTISNLSNTIRPCGSGMGEFTYNMIDLQPGTTYYVRAYATNEKGTAYGEEVSFTTKEQSSTEPVVTETITVNGVSFKMVAVEGGTFTMGATSEQGSDAYSDESPTHSVTLSDFAIGETEVTQELWKAVMGSNPSSFSGTNLPVEKVSWNDCQTFISKLNNLTGKNFRLPTEAEWEYAARGGNKSKGYKYAGSNTLGDVAWYSDNSSSKTHPVKQKQANELGLYDMSGNVWEWCQDWYGSYSSSAQTNPTGSTSGSSRVNRGGSWCDDARLCRVSRRLDNTPASAPYRLGLRLALGAAIELEVALPTLTTNAVTQITETTAVAGGNVTSDGGAEITERGVVYSTNTNPVITNLNNTIRPCGSGTGVFTYTMTDLQPNTTYYVRAYAKNDVGTAYGEEVSFTTKEQSSTPNNGTENGYAYVDLGLSVKWATMNVGASSPEDYGEYFAWGETEPKEVYDWSTYKYCNGSYSLTKYNTSSSNGTIVDNKTQLDLTDDAAYVNWGGAWRMPTDAELTELGNNCTWTWTSQNGVNGYKVTSKSNGNSIFLPAVGYRSGSSLSRAGSDGYYWSGSLRTGSPLDAWLVNFDSGSVYWNYLNRDIGFTVRPVCP